MSKWLVVEVLVLFGAASGFASPPQVANALASQRSGTKLVDISYNLTSATPVCVVSVSVSTNNGATYDLAATNFSGNGYGSGITSGAGKPVVWNAGSDWDGHYSTQVWFKVIAVERNTNTLTFTQNTNIYLDAAQGGLWAQPVYDGTNIVASSEAGSRITVRKYDLNLNPVGSYADIASTNDTDGEAIADHKHIFQNNYHYLVFSISGTGAGSNMWLVKFDRNFNRIGITQVVTNEPPTNDMLLFGDGEYVYVGKFYPEGQAAHKIYKYDGNLNWITNYLEGTGSNTHANADAAMYLDGLFYFVSPQYVGPGANDRYYRIAYDTNFNVVQSREIILQDTNKLGTVNGLSYYNGRFIVHYLKGSNEANPVARAVYDAYNWNLIQNETVITGGNHNPHSVVVNDALYLGYTEQNPGFSNKLVKFTMSEVNPLALVATGIGYAGPVVVDTLGFLSAVSADFDGDGKADPAVYQASTGTWLLKLSSTGYTVVALPTFLGGSGYTALAGDFDGDRIGDPAVYESATANWSVKLSSAGYSEINLPTFLGGAGYTALAADFDGDGKADPAVYQASTGTWLIKLSLAGYEVVAISTFLGGAGYTALAADFDGDDLADPAVYQASTATWLLKLSSTGYTVVAIPTFLGGAGYTALAGDFDSDGLADPAVADVTTGHWKIKLSSGNYNLVDLPQFLGE